MQLIKAGTDSGCTPLQAIHSVVRTRSYNVNLSLFTKLKLI